VRAQQTKENKQAVFKKLQVVEARELKLKNKIESFAKRNVCKPNKKGIKVVNGEKELASS
jgi:hypothetical protein